MKVRPRVGDRVTIPWGFREVTGEVFRVEGRGDMTWVTVEVYLDGDDESTLATMLLRDVQAAPAAA